MQYFIVQHAHALELLADHLAEGKRALDVGSGSGYLTACMALLVTKCCFGLERIRFIRKSNQSTPFKSIPFKYVISIYEIQEGTVNLI